MGSMIRLYTRQQLRRFLAFFTKGLFFIDIFMYDHSIKESSQVLSLTFQGATLGAIKRFPHIEF